MVFFVVYGMQYFFFTLRLLLDENANIYHAHDFETLLLGYITAKAKKAKLIYDSHELWIVSKNFLLISKRNKDGIIKRLFIIMEHFLIKRSDKVITVNESIAKYLAHKYKIEKPVVICNFSEYSNVETSNTLREKLALDEEKKIVLYHGGIFKDRGLEKLIECSKSLNENVIIVIMGDGSLKNKLQKKVEEESFDRVKILDAVPLDVLTRYIASADIGIHPIQNISLNHYYSLPNKLGEFIMAGIPFAVSDFPEMRKLATDENMGIVFDPENYKSITKAIHELLDPEVYALKRENVLKAKKKYSWEKESLKLIKLYEELNFQIR